MTSDPANPVTDAESPTPAAEIARLAARIETLEKERTHLIAVVAILQEISTSLHFVDILQTIARRLGETFDLDRSSIFLRGKPDEARLVASFEDPTVRNLVVDLTRYPELKLAFTFNETVFIRDATTEPMLAMVTDALERRNVGSIVIVPIRWHGAVIGALFLRSQRGHAQLSNDDLKFFEVIASLTANALRNAHASTAMSRSRAAHTAAAGHAELQRIALVAFLRRLLDRYTHSEGHMWAETQLPRTADEELDRLVGVALKAIEEESKDKTTETADHGTHG